MNSPKPEKNRLRYTFAVDGSVEKLRWRSSGEHEFVLGFERVSPDGKTLSRNTLCIEIPRNEMGFFASHLFKGNRVHVVGEAVMADDDKGHKQGALFIASLVKPVAVGSTA